MKIMNKDALFRLGKKIVNRSSKEIVKLSRKKPLGSEIGSVGASGHPTKVADTLSEKIAIAEISAFSAKSPDHRIVLISEESGVIEFGDPHSKVGCFMILDPLDGSNNLRPWKTPAPFVTISLALGRLSYLKENDNLQSIEVGIVKDIFNDRLYYAKKDNGGFVEGFGKIISSPETDITKSIVSIDLDLESEKYKNMYSGLRNLLEKRRYRRRSGSSVLDFMKVACGEYDSFVSLGGRMKLYDVAAARLIAEEAGATFEIVGDKSSFCIVKKLIETKNGKLLKDEAFNVMISGNKTLHEKIKDLCKPAIY